MKAMTFSPVEKLAGLDELSPALKQIPILLLFGLAAGMSASIKTLTVSSWRALVADAYL